MAVRVAYYALAFYMDYIANYSNIEKLPALFPIVVYNGSDRWTAPETLAELIEGEPALGDYGVACRYFELLIEEFVKLFIHETDKQAVSLLVNWFRQLAVHGRVRSEDYQVLEREYHSAQGVREMLIDALAKEKQTIREEGRKEASEEGAAAMRVTIEQLLQRRFGSVPAEVSALLQKYKLAELQPLVNPALDAADLDAFLAHLPRQSA